MAPLRKAAQFRVLAAQFTRGLPKRFAPQESEGAGNAGCALHPRSRVQNCAKKRTRAYRFSGSDPTFPAQWLYGLLRALPGVSGFLASVAFRIWHIRARSGRPASERLDANH